jgi:hypothetical protein
MKSVPSMAILTLFGADGASRASCKRRNLPERNSPRMWGFRLPDLQTKQEE